MTRDTLESRAPRVPGDATSVEVTMGADAERDETEAQRIDRNWIELLQELRIVQTGGQVLTGFLLVVPFQSRFQDIGTGFRSLYLVVLALALVSTVVLLTPVMIHRVVFRSHRKDHVLRLSSTLTRLGLGTLAAALAGVVGLVFGIVLGAVAGGLSIAVMAVLLLAMLVVLPARTRRRVASERYEAS